MRYALGFGNAAGLLAEMGLMAGKKSGGSERSSGGGGANSEGMYSSSDSAAEDQGSDTEDYKQLEAYINPVTGRAEIEPSTNPFEGMTDEQKEYEAMRLVNDLDRLTRITGTIKPARIGSDGRPVAVEHVLELQHASASVLTKKNDDNDDDWYLNDSSEPDSLTTHFQQFPLE